MKQSIAGRLIGGGILLVVTVALLAVCFGAGAAANRAVERDQELFADAARRASAVAADLELLSQGAGAASPTERLRQIGASASEIDGLLNDAVTSTSGSILYSARLKEAARALQSTMRSRWDSALQDAMDTMRAAAQAATSAGASGAVASGGAVGPGAAAVSESLSTFLLATKDMLDDFTGMARQFDRANATMGRTLQVLFLSFAVLGTVALFGFILWALLSLRRDVKKLIIFSRSIFQGHESPFVEVAEDGEIGALAAELRRIGSRESLAARLRAASERVVADFPASAENAARLQESFTGQTQIVKDTSRGLAEVTQTVRDVARSAASSLDAAREGGSAVETSLQSIQRAIDAAKLLEERASRIEEVVTLIGDVADQTELLSLNAAIEAARAGEAGRGFTVVAQQVRKLADRSARSVSEIADLALVVLEAVRRIASDATNSFQTIEALRRDLKGMSDGLASINELANSAVDGAGRMESALAQALELGSDTMKRAQAIASANNSLKEEVEQVADIMSQMPAGGAPPGNLVSVGDMDAGPGASPGASAPVGARDASELDAGEQPAGPDSVTDFDAVPAGLDAGPDAADEAGSVRQEVTNLRGPLPGGVETVDAIEELPPAEEEPDTRDESTEASTLEELESAEED